MTLPTVRGHAAAKSQFAAAFARNRVGQAYLFAGPDGVGRRTFAVALTQALLCESPPGDLAGCGHCPACAQVAAGTHPQFHVLRTPADKHEVPVDDVRAFVAGLHRTPARVPRTVGLVQDADDFNPASANAMLKTLEEPPPGVTLVLRSGDPATQLPTVRSRCQVVAFHPLADADVAAVLADRGVTDPAEVARLVALAGGRPGAAVALADGPLWAFRGGLLSALAAPRPDAVSLALKWVELCDDAGKESADQRARASASLRLAADVLRAALVASVDPAADFGPETAAVRAVAARGGPDGVAAWLEVCADADYLIGRRVQLALVFEKLAAQLAVTPA